MDLKREELEGRLCLICIRGQKRKAYWKERLGGDGSRCGQAEHSRVHEE